MRPRAICTFGSIVAVLLCMFSTTAMADCVISTQSGTMAKLLAFEAPEWVWYVSIHLNTKVSNIEVSRSCISIKREDKCVRFAAISIITRHSLERRARYLLPAIR